MPLASIIGGLIGQGGALAAGNAAGQAGSAAGQRAAEQIAINRSAISPWQNVGGEAVNKLAQLYGLGHLSAPVDKWGTGRPLITTDVAGDRANALRDFQASPGYQWRLGEGVKALDRSAAAKGMVLSGAQARGVTEFGQNTASNEFGNYTNALKGLSDSGESGVLGTNQTNANIFNAGNNAEFQGDMARASSYSNAANALASGIGKGVQNAAAIGSFLAFPGGLSRFASV